MQCEYILIIWFIKYIYKSIWILHFQTLINLCWKLKTKPVSFDVTSKKILVNAFSNL